MSPVPARPGLGAGSRPAHMLLLRARDAISAAFEVGPDIVVVHSGAGDEGAVLAAALLRELRENPRCPPVYVRFGRLAADGAGARLDVVMAAAPDGIVLSGAVGRRAVQQLGARLAVIEAERDLPDGTTRIIALTETAAGVLSSPEGSGARLAGIAFDPGRLAHEIGCDPGSSAIILAGAKTILTAAAAGVPAIYVFSSEQPVGDAATHLDALRREGFGAVLTDDPATIALAKRVFRP